MTRIVAGSAGGRRLAVPRGRGVRPTADRAREGLFSSLGGDLSGRSFLDLYAGSGAVGLEAASRGAAPVVLVEQSPAALTVLRGNVAAVGLPAVRVQAAAVERFVAAPADAAFDVVFLDPPYSDPVQEVLRLVAAGGWVTPGGVVVLERATRDAPPDPPAGLVIDRSRRYGEATLWYLRRP